MSIKVILELELAEDKWGTETELITEVAQDLEQAIHSEEVLNPESSLAGATVLDVFKES